MLHGPFIFVILGYFIIVIIFLTIFWRIAIAVDRIAEQAKEIANELKKLAVNSGKEEK